MLCFMLCYVHHQLVVHPETVGPSVTDPSRQHPETAGRVVIVFKRLSTLLFAVFAAQNALSGAFCNDTYADFGFFVGCLAATCGVCCR